jgi:large subunit ribosomal protein L22
MIRETVKLNHLHIAPRKVRLVANLIKNLSANEAEAQLMVLPKRSAEPILKLLKSGVANMVNNRKVDGEKLVIESITVNEGPSLKRFLPRSMGRATPLLKRTCHVTIVLKEVVGKKKGNRFNTVKPKKEKEAKKIIKAGEKSPKQENKDMSGNEGAISKESKGFAKKFFTRKSV